MELAITETLALTMRDDHRVFEEPEPIGVEGGRIAYVGPAAGFDDADRTIDGSNRVAMPGLVNVRAHTGMTVLRGGAQDVPEIE